MCDKIQNGQVHGWLIKAFAIGISLYHVLYISGVLRIFGIYLVTAQHRAISIGTITALTLLVYPMKGKGGEFYGMIIF